MAQIRPVTSEALEAQIRNLLPSQAGFGEDLQASNVITPIIDLTAAAQGTLTPDYLQTAFGFQVGSASRLAGSGTNTEINTAGFWKVRFVSFSSGSSAVSFSRLQITDGLSVKTVYEFLGDLGIAGLQTSGYSEVIIYLRSGDSLQSVMGTAACRMQLQYQQIADVNGNLVYPLGFTPQ